MSVPKPKVRRAPGDWPAWRWTCDCEVDSREWAGWEYAQMEAERHSRTHTAERIADELDRLAGLAHSNAAWNFKSGRHREGIEARGNSEGIESAALLVRRYLVRGAS